MYGKIGGLLKAGHVDSIVLSTNDDMIDANFYYFSGVSKTLRLSSALVVLNNNKKILLTNPLDYGTLRNLRGFEVHNIEKREQSQTILKKNAGRRVGLNYNYINVNSFGRLKNLLAGRKFKDMSNELGDARSIKTSEEIKNIREACRITGEIFEFIENSAKGKREIDIANALDGEARRLGAEGLSFDPIIASGKNSSVPHHKSGAAKIKRGVLLCDIGVIYNGYCSDITRTYSVGEPTATHEHMYEIVNAARKEAIGMVKKGAKARDLFSAANGVIKKEFGSDMVHSLGHGLGILVHDYPEGLSEKSRTILKENMVMTIEPGYYNQHGGVRIEDDIVVKNHGAQMLSKAPDRLPVI